MTSQKIRKRKVKEVHQEEEMVERVKREEETMAHLDSVLRSRACSQRELVSLYWR